MGIEGKIDYTLDPDLMKQRAQDAKMKELEFDQKTGLSSGDLLLPRLENLVKKLNFTPNENKEDTLSKIMVIALDMNGLKFFNDNYGHTAGDKALIAFADRLRMVIKDVDFIFRHNNEGGDEFIVLLQIFRENTDSDKIFERIKKAVHSELSIKIDGKDFPITAAMGYVVVEKGSPNTITEILHAADLEMYEDKVNGKEMAEDYSI